MKGQKIYIAGYAAIFNKIDKGGDIIRPGAFDAINRAIPLLWQHDPHRMIGHIDYLQVDRRGLRVIASLLPDEASKEATELVQNGAVSGLSFGYRVRHAKQGQQLRAPRELLALDVAEISLVTFPMQPLARVHLIQ